MSEATLDTKGRLPNHLWEAAPSFDLNASLSRIVSYPTLLPDPAGGTSYGVQSCQQENVRSDRLRRGARS